MPAKSKTQWKYIQYLRTKHKNKENTPESKKWIWNDEWFSPDYADLPEQGSDIDNMITMTEVEYKKVIRQGKEVKIAIPRKGYKVVKGKYIRQSPGEIRKAAIRTKKAHQKFKGVFQKGRKKRDRSIRKHTWQNAVKTTH